MSCNVIHTEFVATLTQANVTQSMFAKLCGVTNMGVNHWCRGRRAVPQWAWALALALKQVRASTLTMPPNLPWHAVLGVSPKATARDVKLARAKLAKKYHPDTGGSTDAMQRINAAYDEGLQIIGP